MCDTQINALTGVQTWDLLHHRQSYHQLGLDAVYVFVYRGKLTLT